MELTAEQKAKVPSYVEKWWAIGSSTEECDMIEAVKWAKKAYSDAGQPEPKWFFGPFNNPIESAWAKNRLGDHYYPLLTAGKITGAEANKRLLAETAEAFKPGNKIDVSKLSIEDQIYGSIDASWLKYYNFADEVMENPAAKRFDGLIGLAKACGWWTPLSECALFQHRPLEIHLTAEKRISNTNGPAIKFRGSHYADVYCVNNTLVTKKIVDRDYTAQDILKENNQEYRRVMFELMGMEEFARQLDLKPVASDDWGSLYRMETGDREPIFALKVVNSTPEPDGSYKDYWIMIDPNRYNGDAGKVPHAAVASTWRRRENPEELYFNDYREYNPAVET